MLASDVHVGYWHKAFTPIAGIRTVFMRRRPESVNSSPFKDGAESLAQAAESLQGTVTLFLARVARRMKIGGHSEI